MVICKTNMKKEEFKPIDQMIAFFIVTRRKWFILFGIWNTINIRYILNGDL